MGRLVTRAELVAEGRSWVGTPILWQQCRKGVGTDCKGVIVGVALALDLDEGRSLWARQRTYPRNFSTDQLVEGLDATLIRTESPGPGDVVAVYTGLPRKPRHLALLSDRPGWVIHAFGRGFDKVVEAPLVGGQRLVFGHWTWPSLVGEKA